MLEPTAILPRTLAYPQQTSRSRAWLRTVSWALAAVICAQYIFYFASLATFPLQDFPNHLARGVVMSDLLFNHGARYGHLYSLNLQPVPYVLHDLLLATGIDIFGARVGGTLFLLLVLLSMPLALLFYLRAAQLVPRARATVFLIGLYLGTDSFFLLAFMGFRLALALMLVSLGLAQMLRRQWSRPLFYSYVGSLVVGYLTHLTATVFFATALGVSSVVRLALRTTRLEKEALLWLPLIAVVLLHTLALSPPHSAANPATYEFFWGTWQKKWLNLTFEYSRFGTHLDRPMLLLLVFCLLWPLRRYWQPKRLLQPAVLEALAIAAAFLGVYCVLPMFYSDSAFVDVRALPVVLIMVMLACLNVPGVGSSGRAFGTWTVISLAAVLAVGNLAYLARHVGRAETALNQYRAVGDAIAPGTLVLPIHSLAKDGELRPLLHAAGYLVADRGAEIPYLFSGDRGDPMKYFRYRDRPYWPEEDWYHVRQVWDRATEQTYTVGGRPYTWRFDYSPQDGYWKPAELIPVDWNRVACNYDYLLMTRPVDLSLIGVSFHVVRENATATLAAVDRSTCRRELVTRRTVRLQSEH